MGPYASEPLNERRMRAVDGGVRTASKKEGKGGRSGDVRGGKDGEGWSWAIPRSFSFAFLSIFFIPTNQLLHSMSGGGSWEAKGHRGHGYFFF